jgi:hypothetical protein
MLTTTTFSVDLASIQDALTQLPTEGNRTILNKPTGNFFYDPWTIADEYKDTVWDTILSTLPGPVGEARVIKLDPGTTYYCHADIDDRYHLNLQGNQSYLIDISTQTMHKLQLDGCWYDMNAGRLHSAVNFGEVYRYQLVVRKLLVHGHIKNPVNIRIERLTTGNDFRYQFDQNVSPVLNKINKMQGMDCFSPSEHSAGLTIEEELLPMLSAALTDNFGIRYVK